jgi:translation initiation factor 5A
VHLVGVDIFTGKKYEDLSPSTHNMDVPNVSRRDFTLIDISDDGFLSLMDDKNELKDDIRLPDGEIGDKIKADFDDGKELLVSVVKAMGEEAAMAVREAPKGNQ